MPEHPQASELHGKLEALFARTSPSGCLIVHVPSTGAATEFFQDEDTGRVTLEFGLKESDEASLAAARAIKLPKPKVRESRHFNGRVYKHYAFLWRVATPDEAARRALVVLAEVKRVPADELLWITDDPEPDQWPSPLPRPERWPPIV